MTNDDIIKGRKTITVPEAGAIYFGLNRNSSYEAVKRGVIPVIRIGHIMRVPVAKMERMVSGEE